MRRFLILLPTIFCLVGCSETETPEIGTEQFSTVPLQKRKPLADFDKPFSSPSRGRLSLSYTAPDENGKTVWLLLFERRIPAKNRPVNTRFEGYVGSEGPVTLLVVEPSHSVPQKKWSIINSIPLGIVSKLRKDSLTLRWLEPAKHKGPVLFVSKLGGVSGSSELIAFPQGWKQSNPVRQIYGAWMNYDAGAKYDFYSVDKRGFLCVTETHSDYTHPEVATNSTPGEITSTKYHFWSGNGWKLANGQF